MPHNYPEEWVDEFDCLGTQLTPAQLRFKLSALMAETNISREELCKLLGVNEISFGTPATPAR
mgnify:CR=1 FL=1|eukprot:scaffold120631_cov28-Tisochrysis_lutea.AAC.1